MTAIVIISDGASTITRTYPDAYIISWIDHKYRIVRSHDGKSSEVEFAPEDAHIVITTEPYERKSDDGRKEKSDTPGSREDS